MKSRHAVLASAVAVALLLVVLPQAVSGDTGITYLGAFRAFSGAPGVYGGGLTYYPAGNGGAGSLFIGRSPVGSGKEIFELNIPALVNTTDINALNTATTLASFDVNTSPNGLAYRSADDKLYYSSAVYGGLAMPIRSINRNGTGESAVQYGPAWNEAGAGLCILPDAWAAAHAAGKGMMTIYAIRGIVFSSCDPWNTPMGFSQLWKYGSPEMTGYTYGDNYNGIAWVEVDTAQDLVVSGSDLPGPAATLWFMRASDFANRGSAVPQPYRAQSVQDKMLTTAKVLYGATYDSANHILYAYEGASGTAIVVHAWSVYDAANINNPPTPVTDLASPSHGYYGVTLAWTAPSDDHGVGGKVSGYDVRYSTSPITEANWASATQATGEPTPSAPGLPEQMVVSGLTRGTIYYFAIKAYDATPLYAVLSNVISVTTDDDIVPPATVTSLAASNVLSRQLQLSWTASGDNGMTGLASSYDVRYSTSPITNDASFAAATAVTQNLTPRTPGSTETLLVTGLTPNTTYHFAIKVADKMPNWSALSNVVTATTNPLPAGPPSAVTNLAVSGSDALSATLSWTAPADANGSAVTGYEIRYSTAAINSGNWSSATVAANLLAPKAPGAGETFTIIGLQPTITYYFAMKGIDEIGNVSAISNTATCTTPALTDMPVVTTVTLVEKAGVATTNYPVTLSLGFAKGDVASNVTVRTPALVLPTQTDVKVTWDDGSVRHALVSFILPQIQANESVPVQILAGGPNYTSGWMTKEELLAGDFEALMAMTVGSMHQNASARQILSGMAAPQYWIKGGICTEFTIRDWNTRNFGQLNVTYGVRVYPAANAIRVSVTVDNTWIDARGNLTYDFDLSLGRSSPQVVFSKTGFTHCHDARWHKVFWQGSTLPQVEIRYDLAYWIKGGFLTNYDTSLVVPAATITSEYTNWNNSAHDIMDGGNLTKYMPTTGGRGEIGPYPIWASLYLLSMDYRLAEVTINYGDLSGSIPMHFRESDPARSFYQRPIRIDDRPTIWTTQVDVGYIQQYIAPADRFPAAIGDLTTPWVVETAHHPSLVYIPYLATGDLYYLEELQFWATYILGASNGSYRNGAQCWLIDQIRGNAWDLRSVVDAAVMTPDSMPEKAYLEEKININLHRWDNMYIGSNGPSIRSYGAGEYTGDSSIDPAHCSYASGIWQDDYFTWAFIHAWQMGYPALNMVHWGNQGVLDRFTDWPGWNRFRGAPYAMPVMGKDAGGNPVQYQTWAEVNDGFSNKAGPVNFGGNVGNPNSYEYAARGVIAMASNLNAGQAVWTWISGQLPSSTLAGDGRWAFVPIPYLAGDISADSHVDVLDLLYFVDSFGTVFGDTNYNPAADFNGDFSIDVVDLLMLVENFGL